MTTAIPLPGAALPPWATSPRPPLMPFLRHTAPDLWKETVFTKSPYQEFTDHLVKTDTRVSVQRTQAPAMATTVIYIYIYNLETNENRNKTVQNLLDKVKTIIIDKFKVKQTYLKKQEKSQTP